ncbi:MAG TPA: TonB family protein [Candidatus Manganitrophaceae bacterium]|nr:TonB family protein [Candidatus Manganitrophaceae bacterium]
MHESRLDEEHLNLSAANRYPYGLFLLLSFLLHLTLLLLIRGWDFTKSPIKEKPDEFIQLVDPPSLPSLSAPAPPPKPPGDVLFGTDRPADLESIPKGKETHLPPIPKSTGPAGRPRSGRSGTLPPADSIRPPAPSSQEGISKREAPSVPIVPPTSEARPQPAPFPQPFPAPQPFPLPQRPPSSDAPAEPNQNAIGTPSPDLPMNPSGGAPGAPSIPLPATPSVPLKEGGRKGAAGGGDGGLDLPSGPGGLPGLPFADSKSLDRLAKVFSDREPAAPKDAVSINTEELKYFSYLLKVKNRIEYIWRYPVAAAERRMEGDLFLNFTIQRNGTVTDVSVVSTSGFELLDQEAVRAIIAASPFAPLPDAWNEDHITITGHFLYLNHSNYIR